MLRIEASIRATIRATMSKQLPFLSGEELEPMFAHYGFGCEDSTSVVAKSECDVASMKEALCCVQPSASLNLLPWCLRLCVLIPMTSQSGGI